MSKFFDDVTQGLLEAIAMEYKNEQNTKSPVIKRIYEDDTWVIDLIDGNVRVSCFEDNRFADEIILTKEQFKNYTK